MNFELYREDIEAVKIALGTCGRMGMSRENALVNSIGHLRDYYEREPEKEYLLGAVLQMRVYLELGFEYEKYENLFDEILRKAEMRRSELYKGRIYAPEPIKLNKSQIRNMLRRWSPTKQNTMTIKEVVEDILNKVTHRKYGTYYYRNHPPASLTGDDVYVLVINENECYFHDLTRERYYTFRDI